MRTRQRCRTTKPGKRTLNPYTRMVAHFAYVQPSERWREWNFRLISARQAQLLVECGEAAWVTRGVNTLEGDIVNQDVGIRALKPTSWERPSPCTLTQATLNAVALATDGEAELTRYQRQEYLKFKVWPLIGDTKAIAVRPRISDNDRRMAENLLRAPGQRRCRSSYTSSGILAAA